MKNKIMYRKREQAEPPSERPSAHLPPMMSSRAISGRRSDAKQQNNNQPDNATPALDFDLETTTTMKMNGKPDDRSKQNRAYAISTWAPRFPSQKVIHVFIHLNANVRVRV